MPSFFRTSASFICWWGTYWEIPIQNLRCGSNFDVITAILITHYLEYQDRVASIQNCYNALKENGLFFTVENFAPSNDVFKTLYLERWKNYQYRSGKGEEECQNHILRYNTEYFPITIKEQIHVMQKCGFQNVEIFWCFYMQVGIVGIKTHSRKATKQDGKSKNL